MAGDLWLADSNILIRWSQPVDPQYAMVQASILTIGRLGDIPCYTSQNLSEFWNVLTRPSDRNGYGFSPINAELYARSIETRFRLLPDGRAVHNTWRQLLSNYGVSGAQVHDARLVAAMLVHGVKRILTLNTKDFVRFSEIEAVYPREMVQSR